MNNLWVKYGKTPPNQGKATEKPKEPDDLLGLPPRLGVGFGEVRPESEPLARGLEVFKSKVA